MKQINQTIGLLLTLFLFPASLVAQPVSSSSNEFAESEWEDDWYEEDTEDSSTDLYGFIEASYGSRLQNNPVIESHNTLTELRNRTELSTQLSAIRLNVSGDLFYDHVIDKAQFDLRTGYIDYSLTDNLDVRVGRQISTWGTGDYLFLNDLFPKDWQSFFSGRDDEYLKAPSDSVKASWYFKNSSVQLIWTPEFEHDKYINGERFSFFSAISGEQSDFFASPIKLNGETWALKLATSADSVDYALYAYKGYWTTPTGLTTELTTYFPKLNVYGASIQSPLAVGLINAEIAWYQSVEDTNGIGPLIPNSQFRALIGYEQELIPNLTFSTQYYLEHTKDYGQLLSHSAQPEYLPHNNRQVATVRFRWLTLQQKLTVNFFAFWSPTNHDAYIKPNVSYRYDDNWLVAAGINLFAGSNNHSFFGQHQDNSNAWLRVRYYY